MEKYINTRLGRKLERVKVGEVTAYDKLLMELDTKRTFKEITLTIRKYIKKYL